MIYIPVWLDQKLSEVDRKAINTIRFTFQYGQIRNNNEIKSLSTLDNDLHSSMVRLETQINCRYCLNDDTFTFQYGQIRN